MEQYYTRGKNSDDLKLKGKVSWVRLREPNKFDKWSLNIHPDAESLEQFRELQAEGVKNQIKKDDDGYYFQISRPVTIELRRGVKTPVTEPWIKDKDGNEFEGNVGNGSEGIVHCEVYSHPVPNTEKRAKAIRLMGLEITDLIPFES